MSDRHTPEQGHTRQASRAFTLIEMLVVISVIGILAAMIINLGPLASKNKVNSLAKVQLEQLVTKIEQYKAKKGFYPPSNTNDVSKPPLYYELAGTTNNGSYYETLNKAARISAADVSGSYGIDGFVNTTRNASDPDAPSAEAIYSDVKEKDLQDLGNGAKYFGINYHGPDGDFSRWRYNSLNPANNPEGFDLWIELIVGGKTNVYANWKK